MCHHIEPTTLLDYEMTSFHKLKSLEVLLKLRVIHYFSNKLANWLALNGLNYQHFG
jgi:hypothetical protein